MYFFCSIIFKFALLFLFFFVPWFDLDNKKKWELDIWQNVLIWKKTFVFQKNLFFRFSEKKIFFSQYFFFFKNINYGGPLYRRRNMNTSSIWTLVPSKFQVLSILFKFYKKNWLCLFPIFLWYSIYTQFSKNDALYIYSKIFMGNRQTKFFFLKT